MLVAFMNGYYASRLFLAAGLWFAGCQPEQPPSPATTPANLHNHFMYVNGDLWGANTVYARYDSVQQLLTLQLSRNPSGQFQQVQISATVPFGPGQYALGQAPANLVATYSPAPGQVANALSFHLAIESFTPTAVRFRFWGECLGQNGLRYILTDGQTQSVPVLMITDTLLLSGSFSANSDLGDFRATIKRATFSEGPLLVLSARNTEPGSNTEFQLQLPLDSGQVGQFAMLDPGVGGYFRNTNNQVFYFESGYLYVVLNENNRLSGFFGGVLYSPTNTLRYNVSAGEFTNMPVVR